MSSSISNRKPWVLGLTYPYVRYRMRKSLDGCYVRGLEEAQQLAKEQPLIIACNHVSWWDSLFILLLAEKLAGVSHCYMDAANLNKLPFFGWWGAIKLDRSHPRRALHDLDAGQELVREAGHILWIFPQGDQRPAHLRPLGLAAGVRRLAKKSQATVLPLSLNYLHRQQPQVTAAASFGQAILPPHGNALLPQLEDELCKQLVAVDDFITGQDCSGFVPLVPPQTANEVPAAGRLLAAGTNQMRSR
jgi:1-acyl-sn-glycerol-3-phosphate acyltransferase